MKAEQRMFGGMFPLCCPTFRDRASRVRVPVPNEEHEQSLSCHLVVLADAPSDFDSFGIAGVDFDLLRGGNPQSRDFCVHFFSDTHTHLSTHVVSTQKRLSRQ